MQLREIKSVHPDVSDQEVLAALEDKQGKCVLAPALARTQAVAQSRRGQT